ncbi:T9SS type A sorting domain-containing protein [uncultured Kordia sp.]|uniref:T9SS type A sorting domain-containing protein n=1 Tax=uncultured Kordia sp. TaxID=507699 RepID=UPI002622CB97|nr:T9SS type A sorting domain-containing protein [uncultured Kordia sp.]
MKLNLQIALIYLCSLTLNAQNLVVNGSAEIEPFTSNGWTQVSGNWLASNASSQITPVEGTKFFYAGNTALGELSQDIDVSANNVLIDTGLYYYTFSGYIQSFFQTPADSGKAIAEYRDENGNILATFDTGFITSTTEWYRFEDTRVAPIGTRTIRVRLISLRNNGTSNDGVFDDIQLVESVNVAVPDMNFEQALVNQNIDSDGIVNGFVLRSDVINITYLDVNSSNISDLTGIEAFTSLETLFVYNNNLTTVNLSQNTALTGLLIAINQLTSIDVSNNTNLISLSLNNNSISDIDLSANTNLEQVYIENNDLTSLDVSALNLLEELVIPNNMVTTLNLSQNPLLTTVTVNNNALTSLDIRNGANSIISTLNFTVTANPNLTCIEVDDVNYSNTTWTQKDVQTTYSIDCSPQNDDCSNAISITLAQDTVGTTQGATASTNTPSCLQNGIVIFDVWYEFIAPASGSVTMTINAGNSISKVALYESCTDANPLLCAEGELLAENLTPNATYYVQVWLEANTMNRTDDVIVLENTNGEFILNIADTTTLSVDDIDAEANQIRMFPNPTNNQININAPTNLDHIAIYDMSGKLILQNENLRNTSQTLNLEKLSSGMYMVQIKTDNTTTLKKLIIN